MDGPILETLAMLTARPSSAESWVFNLNNAVSPYPHVTPMDHAELRCVASLRRGVSVQRPQPGNIQRAGHCGSGIHGWRQSQSTSLLASDPLSAA